VDAEAALAAWAQRSLVESQLSIPKGNNEVLVRSNKGQGLARLITALVAGLAIGAGVFAFVQNRLDGLKLMDSLSSVRVQGSGELSEPMTASVAVLKRGVDPEWGVKEGGAPSIGAALNPGNLVLRSGVAEIEFIQGARLCMEGPAEVLLVSGGEAFCRSGRVTVHVPEQARGFKLGTPSGDVVDLGTDFGVDLSGGTPGLVVFKGEVEWHQKGVQVRKFTPGSAVDLGSPGAPVLIAAKAGAFDFSRQFDAKASASQRAAFMRWKDASIRRNSDPDLKLHLDFLEEPESRMVRNQASSTGGIQDGALVGCQWVEGRLPGKRALLFRSVNDRVRLKLPGEYNDLTLCAWVQVQSLPARQSSLLMSEGVAAQSLHWQVLQDGSICLGILNSQSKPLVEDYISPVVFTPEQVGQWTHLAVVLDSAKEEVRFLANGVCQSRHPLRNTRCVKPGMVELGNWTPSTAYWGSKPVRNLAGAMDEVLLFSRALRDEEIKEMQQ
jgi:hypothetical protein